MIDADGREVRVSSPRPRHLRGDRPDRRCHQAPGRGVLRRRRRRASCGRCATGRRRSSAGRRACTRGSCSRPGRSGGGDAFYQKRVPKGAPDYLETARIKFPSGRHADEICPTEIAVVAWCAAHGHDDLPPLAGAAAPTSTTPTSCASTSTRSPAPTSPTPCGSPAEARELLDELGYAGFPKTSGSRGIHIYVRIEPRWTFTDVRHAAIAFGRELERRCPAR